VINLNSIINATKARENFFQLLEQVINFSQPITVTSKNGNAVVVSESDWNSMQETIHLMSVPGLWQDILDSHKPDAELFSLEDLGIVLD
jgi:prevent-host-death family protein